LKLKHSLISAAALSLAAFSAQAQFAKPEDAIKYRQSVLTVQARAFGAINAMNKGDVPFNAAAAQANASIIATLSTLPWNAFGAGTESPKTRPEIWTDAAGFKASADKYVSAAAALDVAAKTGDAAQVKTAWGALAGTCKQCHDAFQKK
jgi:cytochrome c556